MQIIAVNGVSILNLSHARAVEVSLISNELFASTLY